MWKRPTQTRLDWTKIVLQLRTESLVEIEAKNHTEHESFIIEIQKITKLLLCSNIVIEVEN